MKQYYRWLLVIPILILILGTSMLLSNEALIKNFYSQENKTVSQVQSSSLNVLRPVKRSSTYGQDLKNNRESTYPYFLLGTGLLLFLLVLPKLSELSFSPTNGITLKVLQEAQFALAEAKTAALAVEAKVKQPNRTAITAEPLSPTQSPDLKEEIKKLEESSIKLATYTQLLESKAIIKNKAN